MSHTKEQEVIVTKVLSSRPDQFYEILSISKSADSSTIKKSYRKLAIKLHPDKNPHPRAAEAFKILNKAWEVLGDEEKKRIYDQTGLDPTSRSSGTSSLAQTHPFASGFRQRGPGNAVFEEDLFDMFFGGGRMGGGRPTGFTFGNQGFTFQSFGGDPFARRAPPRPQRPQESPQLLMDLLRQLLPLLFVIVVPLLLGLLSSQGPKYLFSHSPSFTEKHSTPNYEISYFVSRDQHIKNAQNQRYFDKLGRQVERDYIENKRLQCNYERMERQRLMDESYGWLYNDEEKLEKARKMPMPSCNKLRKMNLL